MHHETFAHRYADIILNADYSLRTEIEEVVGSIEFNACHLRFISENLDRTEKGKKVSKGYQSTLNAMFREAFTAYGWETEKNVFADPDNDLAIDFWKREIGVDVAFVHRSFIGGDLLRLQAAAEVKEIVRVGVYICPTKAFARQVSTADGNSLVSFERAQWYLENFYSVLTVPILLMGLKN
jgi:hypothetical protein